MPRGSRRGAGQAGALALLGLTACGGGELATRWVLPQAAIVRCTTAGRTRMPPVLLDLPIPPVPTGLMARQLDPMALNDMGFERDHPICASLAGPPAETVERSFGELTGLLALYRETGTRARQALGSCACDIARKADVDGLVASCWRQPHRRSCEPTPQQVEQAQALVQPLREALSATPIPRVHWRVAGRTDRPGWMVRRLEQLLPRHAGGATVFVPGQAVPSRDNHVLIRRMLDVPGVAAVVRLDSGQSVLVIRELEGALVLDLLSLPTVAPELAPLMPLLDGARADELAQALSRPASAWAPPLPLEKGNVVHLDRAALRAVDELLLGMAPLAGQRGARVSLPEPEDPPLVDTVTLQADFGTRGKVLRARLALSPEGRQWAQGLGSGQLGTQLERLGLPMEPPALAAAAETQVELLLYRGPTDRLVFDGLRRVPGLLRSLEMLHPNSVQGSPEAWDVTLPPGAVAPGGSVEPVLELRDWAQRVGSETYRLQSSFDARREVLELSLKPD